MDSDLPPALPGDKYLLGDLLGVGGMGVVYRATQPALERTVAIKFLRPEFVADAHVVAHFHREALAAARVVHPNLVTVLDLGETDDGQPYLVMEYVAGPRLRELAVGHPMAVDVALDFVSQLLAALAATHRAGVIHGDVKSDNILVDVAARGDQVKLVDFGLARIRATASRPGGAGYAHDDEDEGYVSGTPEYMAPEVIRRGEPTPASDLYAAGIILYELLTGVTPFVADTSVEIMSRHLTQVATPPSLRRPEAGISPRVDQIVARALAKQPAERFADADAFAAALAEVAHPVDRAPTCAACGSTLAPGIDVCPWCQPPRADDATPALATVTSHGWHAPEALQARQRRRLALGTSTVEPDRAERLRHAIGTALRRGAPDALASGYIELAALMASRGDIDTALRELQEGLDIVNAGRSVRRVGPRAPASRLRAALAYLRSAPRTAR